MAQLRYTAIYNQFLENLRTFDDWAEKVLNVRTVEGPLKSLGRFSAAVTAPVLALQIREGGAFDWHRCLEPIHLEPNWLR